MTKKKTTPKTIKPVPFVIARCTASGVHAGEMVSKKSNGTGTATIKLRNARRLWYYTGSASLSELAVYGSKNPTGCKFAAKVDVELFDCCELIYTRPDGAKMIREQPEWLA